MRRPVAVLVVALVVGSIVAGPVSGPASAASAADPDVSVTVGGSAVADGDRYETDTDDRITVEAAVGEAAPNGTTLTDIVVRVDGERAASWSVDNATATRRVRPDYDSGNNTVRVIVTDSADNVNSTTFTVYKDAEPPHVFLTEPYDTAPWHDITDGNVTGTNHTFVGQLLEETSVERVVLAHSFGDAGSTTAVSDPGENFSVPLELGYSGIDNRTNRIRIDAVDEFGNTRTYIFSVSVSDGGPPSLSVGPVPNETADNRVVLDGTARDDVWVRSVNVTVEPLDRENGTETTAVHGPSAYDYDGDGSGRRVTFREPLHFLHPGTYEVTVRATDVTGSVTTETYTVERLPDGAADRTPTVEVDRDRTVVTGPETLFLSGASFDGVTRRLVVETRDASGETVDYQVVHEGSNRDRVDFDREVAIADGRTRVVVRATGPDGTEVATAFFVNGSSRETFVGAPGDDESRWPVVAVTPLQDGRPGTASSSVTVRRAPAGSVVALPPADGPGAVAASDNVTLASLELAVAAETNVTGVVVVRESAAGPLRGPPDARPAATVSIQHSVPDGQVDELVLSVRVDRSYLAAGGFDAANLTLYRGTGGNWTQLETDLVERGDDAVRYRASSPGLSVFSLAAPPRTGTGTAANGTAAPANGTAGPTNATAGNETAGNRTASNATAGGSGAEARVFVSNVTVNRTQVGVNETVLVNATLSNAGNASGTYVAGLQTVHGPNRTFVAKRSVTVPAGGEKRVQFTTRFAEPGNHTVSVNGTRAGPVVVSSGGGLLSVFAFIPLRLVGLVLGGLVGLLVVLTLVRFVLRRVGGEEAEG